MTNSEREMCDDLGNGVDSMLEDWAAQRLNDGYGLGHLEHKLVRALEIIRAARQSTTSNVEG